MSLFDEDNRTRDMRGEYFIWERDS